MSENKKKIYFMIKAPLCQLGSSLVLLPLLHSSLKTLTSLRLFDSVAFLSQFSRERDGEARRGGGGTVAAQRRWHSGGGTAAVAQRRWHSGGGTAAVAAQRRRL